MKPRLLRRMVRELARGALTFLVSGAVVVGVTALTRSADSTSSAQQGAGNTGPVQKVRNASELRAQTQEDRAVAAYFDREGQSLLLTGGTVAVPGSVIPPIPPPPPGTAPDDPAARRPDFLQNITCASDAIVIGQAVSSRTLLNRSETFLITNYEVAVSEWIWPRRRGGTLHAAMLGGAVQVGDQTLRAIAARPLQRNTPALLFLGHVPGAPQLYVLPHQIPISGGSIAAEELPEVPGLENPATGRIPVQDILNMLRGKSAQCRGRQ